MRLLAAALAVFGMGCSFVFVDGPPTQHQRLPAFECSTGRTVPVLDTLWAVLQTGNLALAASKTDEEWDDQYDGDPPFSRNVAIGTYAALAAFGVAGAYYGYTTVGECRDAKAQLMLRSMTPGTFPQQGTWPPPPGALPPGPLPPPPVAPAPVPVPAPASQPVP